MRRVRPYIPLDVRVQVAERQLRGMFNGDQRSPIWWALNRSDGLTLGDKLAVYIETLSEQLGDVLQLDHDPALILRQYKVDRRKPPAAWYTPNANDPDHLVYRPIRDHLQKTVGRKADAEKTVTSKGSDQWLKTKFRRLEQPRKKPKAKIPARAKPWPKRPRPFAKRPASR